MIPNSPKIPVIRLMILFLILTFAVFAEEGMWTFDNLPNADLLEPISLNHRKSGWTMLGYHVFVLIMEVQDHLSVKMD